MSERPAAVAAASTPFGGGFGGFGMIFIIIILIVIYMTMYHGLYELANGIYAAGRIGEALNMSRGSMTRSFDGPNIVTVLSRILEILSEYAPEKQRSILGDAVNRSRVYLDVYQNLNQTLNTYRSRGPDKNQFVNTLTILQPVLGRKERILIDKIVKLNEVFS